ncbi:uncharacterized protein LOC123564786 [Mercenaria mercenaria]|uniref:uncharacterized protein LOC123564786 n=1 Tax=Mercenaria mercenaria TaxID=6596 RepID=UPI00234E73BA|nr:uncharacterized protein LOC123564786 [Mercenaria mercenaria]
MGTGTLETLSDMDSTSILPTLDRNLTEGLLWSSNGDIIANTDGAGDCNTQKLVKLEGVVDTSEDTKADDLSHGGLTVAERFVSILDKRRQKRKVEEDIEVEWKPSIKPDVETVASRVDSLISKLKRQLNEEKQTRSTVVKSNYSQFSNGVDAFLRYHEKPRADIQFSEDDGITEGEGLYSFAVRPSKIRKRKKDTFDVQENSNIFKMAPSEYLGTTPEHSGDEFKKELKCRNSLSIKQHGDKSGDVFKHDVYLTGSNPTIDEAFNLSTPLLYKQPPTKAKIRQMLSTTDTIQTAVTVNGCIIQQNKKRLTFQETMPFFNLTVTPPNIYIHAMASYKIQPCGAVIGLVNPRRLEYNRCKQICDHAMHSIMRFAISAEIYGRNIPQIYKKSDTTLHPERCIWPQNKSCGKNTDMARKVWSIVALLDTISPNEEIYGHTGPPLSNLITQKDVYHNMISLIRAYPKFEKTYTDMICKISLPEMTKFEAIIQYTLSAKEDYQLTETTIGDMLVADKMFDRKVHPIYATNRNTDVQKFYRSVSLNLKATFSEDMYDQVVLPIFETPVSREIHDRTVSPISFRTPKEVHLVHDHVIFPINEFHNTGNINDDMETTSSNDSTSDELHDPPMHNTTIHELDDDGPFGIMSVYCNSELHSMYDKVSEAER